MFLTTRRASRLPLIVTTLSSLLLSTSISMAMQVVRSDGYGGRGMTLLPHNGAYTSLVVFLHGLGDTADGWASLM